MLTREAALLGTALALAASGCDSQAESTYPGEPLATIHGTVTSTGVTSDASMALVRGDFFNGYDPNRFSSYVMKTAVTGSFPAQFQISLYQPPGIGVFDILRLEAIWSETPETVVKPEDCILGHTDYILLWIGQNVPPNLPYYSVFQEIPDAGVVGIPDAGHGTPPQHTPTVAEYWGGPLSKGYQLMTMRGVENGQPTGFDPVPTGFGTDIHVDISGTVGPDCRTPRMYPYDGGVP